MPSFCSAHRAPVERVIVDDAGIALDVIRPSMCTPITAETIVLMLDECRRGHTIIRVNGTESPDALLEIVERFSETIASSGELGALVVATIRPDELVLPDDAERWSEAADLAEAIGVELVEWFVIGRRCGLEVVRCPRELVGDPPRWGRS